MCQKMLVFLVFFKNSDLDNVFETFVLNVLVFFAFFLFSVGNVAEWLRVPGLRLPQFQFKTYSPQSGVSLKKTLKWHFSLLGGLKSNSKFHLYLNKTKNQNKKFLPESNILASPEASRCYCLPCVLALPTLFCESRGQI